MTIALDLSNEAMYWAQDTRIRRSDLDGGSVRDVLDTVFQGNPKLQGYVLDDQGRLRQHVVVFVDGNRAELHDSVAPTSEVFILQALSGG